MNRKVISRVEDKELFHIKQGIMDIQPTPIRYEKEPEVLLLHYPELEQIEEIGHCFTTRVGGTSKGMFSSMNLSFTRGDEREAVEENYRRLASALEVGYNKFVFSDQTHTTNIRKVTAKDAGKGLVKKRDYSDVDGLITNEQGLVLSTFYADCVPLFFVDRKNHAIGLSHSGWRGTVARMGKVTVEAMKEAYGTRQKDLLCAIGPSICKDCYEVSEDVAEQFKQEFNEKSKELLIEKKDGKYQLDLWKANEIVLLEAGVPQTQILLPTLCTCCNEKMLFSHRASHGKRGNLGAFLYLK